jgi:glycosyltransferase involved in cell wall biosynthesis
MEAHARILAREGFPVTVAAGRGEESALPAGADFVRVPELDTQHPRVEAFTAQLSQGEVPEGFEEFTARLTTTLEPLLSPFDAVIVHNVFTKHFNLPLTAALFRLLDAGKLPNAIAWCHDFTWTSPNSRSAVHPGYPWDLLRTPRPDVTYVTVSEARQRTLAELLELPLEEVRVVYNGVDPRLLLGLGDEAVALVERLDLLRAELILLMPVRVTQAKNVEYALRVLAALRDGGMDARLVLTGPPDPHDAASMAYFHELQATRDELGLGEAMRFVFEAGPDPEEPYTIGMEVVGALYRTADLLFMPSHREGFGMPVLEAGLVGLPVVASDAVPAAVEVGGEDVIVFSLDESPRAVAGRIMLWADASSVHQMRRRVRRSYTWEALFRRHILPLIRGGAA